MTKVEHITQLLETTSYEGKLKMDVDAWIADQAGASISLVQKIRVGWYQKLYPKGNRRKLLRELVAQQNQAMADKWKAPKRIRNR